MNRRIVIGMVLVLGLVLGLTPQIQARPNATTKSYGTINLSGGFQAGHFPEVWDLTAGDMTISFTYDGNGLVDDFGGNAHAWAELGVRQVGAGDFNPTWQSEGKGVWLATDYEWTANTFDPDPPGAPTLDLDDKLILQKGGGWDESYYNLPSPPPNPWANYGIWFDRDGVDQWQAKMWGAKDGKTYNTNGRYNVVITLHADSATSGTAYMTVNGEAQGFYVPNWHDGAPDLYPAGMTFTGDMTRMQVFYGLYGYGATHSVSFENITVQGEPAPARVILWNDDNNNGRFDPGEEITADEDPTIKVDVSGRGQFKTGDTLNVPDGTTLTYRLLRGGIAGPWQQATFPGVLVDGDWRLHFATVHVTLWNDDNDNKQFDPGEEITPEEDGAIKVDVSGVGQYQTSGIIHLPPNTDISYRLMRGGIAGPWLKTQFAAGYTDWKLEFATVHITLFNGAEQLGDPHKVDISGVGQFTTGNIVHLPPNTDISYRLLRGGIAGPWLKTRFGAGYTDWKLEFATVTFKFDLPPDAAAMMSTEISGYGTVPHNGKAHLPPGVSISFRARRGGWAGGWFQQVFEAGDGTVIWRLKPTYTSAP